MPRIFARASLTARPLAAMQLAISHIPLAAPVLSQVTTALRDTTESLARELVTPTNQAPSWTDFEWRIARAVAGMHGVSSLLRAGLRWKGPDGWHRFLDEQQHQSILRHREIKRLLAEIDSLARRDGAAIVALKGAALYGKGIYAAGERPMADIDLLIHHKDVRTTARVLESCGYEAALANRRHLVFRPRISKVLTGRLGEHIDNPIKIELHTKLAEHLPIETVDITRFVLTRGAHPGLNPYPSATTLMLHLLLHAAGNMRARALRLIQLHDIALLAPRLESDHWKELLAMRPQDRPLWWTFAPLHLTARYYPAAIPSALSVDAGAMCPWILRNRVRHQRLSDVSWSNIRIAAFPGLEWSRTLLQALAFIKSRIWPTREARTELGESASQIPGAAAIPWYGISHGARMLRWVFTRPPRVQTLLSVRAALGQE
jgi:hypothetical protein